MNKVVRRKYRLKADNNFEENTPPGSPTEGARTPRESPTEDEAVKKASTKKRQVIKKRPSKKTAVKKKPSKNKKTAVKKKPSKQNGPVRAFSNALLLENVNEAEMRLRRLRERRLRRLSGNETDERDMTPPDPQREIMLADPERQIMLNPAARPSERVIRRADTDLLFEPYASFFHYLYRERHAIKDIIHAPPRYPRSESD